MREWKVKYVGCHNHGECANCDVKRNTEILTDELNKLQREPGVKVEQVEYEGRCSYLILYTKE